MDRLYAKGNYIVYFNDDPAERGYTYLPKTDAFFQKSDDEIYYIIRTLVGKQARIQIADIVNLGKEEAPGILKYADEAEFLDFLTTKTSVCCDDLPSKGIEGFFIVPDGEFGVGAGWADSGFIDDFPVLFFAFNMDERAIYMFYALKRGLFTSINPVVAFVVYSNNAPVLGTGDGVRWELEARYRASSEALAGAPDETVPVTQILTTLTADKRQDNLEFILNKSLIENNDVIHLTLNRITGHASDNYADDVSPGQSGIILETLTHNA